MSDLGRIPQSRRSGNDPFVDGDSGLGFKLLDFWQWSASDVVSNTMRGVLAEFIVAQAIGAAAGVREEWAPFDLLDPRGISIEVKSAAFIQSWHQERHSRVSFNCPMTHGWNADNNTQDPDLRRQAQVYVFALLAHLDQATLNPLDVSQWEFFVVPTPVLDARERSQTSITLNSLRALHGDPVRFDGLRAAIGAAVGATS